MPNPSEPTKYQAIKTFRSDEIGRVNAGDYLWLPDSYAKEQVKLGHIRPADKQLKSAPYRSPMAPKNHQVMPKAPLGKGQRPDPPPALSDDMADQPDDGAEIPSVSSRRGRRSRKPT